MRQSPLTNRDDMAALRKQIEVALDHLDHVLPGQGPILDFVHHNTLHGYQHLPFEEALAASEALTGICGYLPEARFREFYKLGRINEEDLSAAFENDSRLQTEQVVLKVKDRTITRKEIYRIGLLFDLRVLTASQLQWRIEELDALDSVNKEVPEEVRRQLHSAWENLLTHGPGNARRENGVRLLWQSILNKLNLKDECLHPENMLDLPLEQAEQWLAQVLPDNRSEIENQSIHQLTQQHTVFALDQLLAQVGDTISMRGFISALSGVDIFDIVRPLLIKLCGSALDEGIAAWCTPERNELGLYAAWRKTLRYDANPFLHELQDWPLILDQLHEDAINTIIVHLTHLEIPESKWEGYLRRLALELPGWSGMINWRQRHPRYSVAGIQPPRLADYLAIRLTLDRVWLNQVCRDIWKIEARMSSLESYFRKNLSEFMVRRSVFQGALPEYLTQQAEALISWAGSERHSRKDWQLLSDRILTWKCSPMAINNSGHKLNESGWRLFLLCQHLGLIAADIDSTAQEDLLLMLKVLDEFTVTERSQVWLYAYERNYRENLFQALHVNQGRGRWAKRDRRPEAQLIFCMDDREESFRRHLEELNPAIETLGAAGFFGVPMNYKGLDDTGVTPLCPAVIQPKHSVNEIPRRGNEKQYRAHKKGHILFQQLDYLLYQTLRRDLLFSHLSIDLLAPFTLIGLLLDCWFPRFRRFWADKLHRLLEPSVNTELCFVSNNSDNSEQPKLGFTDMEQAERVEGLLRTMGLTDVFAPIVCMIAHGSTSLNNPHEAAHDCGACGGRRGGPNARVFAAMANRTEIRRLLAQRGIEISEDSWFVGAQHDTCSDDILWYDLDEIPSTSRASFERIKKHLKIAQEYSAHERCRRFDSAEDSMNLPLALKHVQLRAADISQVRPEFGHASNAAAVVGRRATTQGLFLDRRVFLISYDAGQDPEGKIVENILLTAGPVGAGINLEYYFSTVDNERFGCGSKVPHNVTGLFGVMEGAGSDLRTGLPSQMIEIHEAMRLQVIVEAKTSVLEQIYQRQESLRELIAGGWIHLSALDPDTGGIFIFERGQGFVPWQAQDKELPVCGNSEDCYRGQTLPIPPILIEPADRTGGR